MLKPVFSSLLWDVASTKIQLSYKFYPPFYSLVYKYTLVSTIFKINNKQKQPPELPSFPQISLLWRHSISFFTTSLFKECSAPIPHSCFPLPTAVRILFPPSPWGCSHLLVVKSSDLVLNFLYLSVTVDTDSHFLCLRTSSRGLCDPCFPGFSSTHLTMPSQLLLRAPISQTIPYMRMWPTVSFLISSFSLATYIFIHICIIIYIIIAIKSIYINIQLPQKPQQW